MTHFLLTLMGTLTLAAAAVAQPASSPPPAAQPGFSAVELGPVFRGANPRVLGLDGAFSLSLGGGRSLWVFGDTLLGHWAPGGRRRIAGMPANTAAVVRDADWATGFTTAAFVGAAAPREVLSVAGLTAKQRLWPLDLVRVGGREWLYYVAIAPFGTGPLDFKVVGSGVAARQPGADVRFAGRGFLWPGDAPSLGASAMVSGAHLYVYAGGAKTHLARAPLGRPDRADAYRYYAGNGRWASHWRDAAALPGSGPEVSVRYNAYLKAFVMVYVPPFGHHVEARFAPRPEGPWSEPLVIAPCQPADGMAYGAKQHPELASHGDQRIVITYNTNGTAAQLDDRPDLYWPHALRVTFKRP